MLPLVLLITCQPVDRALYCQLGADQVDIFPSERQQFAHPKSRAKIQPYEHTITVAIADLHQCTLLFIGESRYFRLFSRWQGNRITGIGYDQPFLYCLLQTFVQRHVVVAKRFSRQSLFPIFVIVELLQDAAFQFFQAYFVQHTKMFIPVPAITHVSGLFDLVFHICDQPIFVPLSQGHRHRVAPTIHTDIMRLLLKDRNSLLFRVAAGRSPLWFAGFIVDAGR